jgi:hypothetical protein
LTTKTCTGDPKLIKEARLSFPSGHSSFSTYSMVFIIVKALLYTFCFRNFFFGYILYYLLKALFGGSSYLAQDPVRQMYSSIDSIYRRLAYMHVTC